MIDTDLVRRKLSRLNMYLDKLKPIANHTDDKKIYEILPIAISDYKEYIRQVDDFLDRMEKKS